MATVHKGSTVVRRRLGRFKAVRELNRKLDFVLSFQRTCSFGNVKAPRVAEDLGA